MSRASRLLVACCLAIASSLAAGCGSRIEFATPESPAAGGGPSEIKKAASGVTVTVIDASARPVPGALVSILDAAGRVVGAEVKADASGQANFPKVARAPGYVAAARTLGLTARHAFDVEGEAAVLVSVLLAPANGARGTLAGAVIDGLTGRPLHGATVAVAGVPATARAGADGAFLLKGVPAGNPIVTATYPGFKAQRTVATLRAGASVRLDFRLAPARDVARFGHTVIATAKAIHEIDAIGSPIWTSRKGAVQVRILPSGNLLAAGPGGVDELVPGGGVMWSYKPMLLGRLGNPQGAYRAGSGNTFIADTDHDRVLEVSTSQQLQRTLRADLSRPMGVERLDDTRTTLVADTGHNRVLELDDAGRIVWGFGDGRPETLNRPTYATRLPNGNTLVTDTGNSRVLEITPDHRLAWDYGGDGQRETCFLPNSAVRLPGGSTLIADTGNQRVIEVAADRSVVWRHAVEGPLFADRF
ncbi:MAG: carboxypeptidase regulatory-like domain-containing protein [Candidatus Sericytochromatia bacterium]|nr:carboxypeptidase regulatory-like domain-containing protein [Candidatus Sericytochromatia bacterium]